MAKSYLTLFSILCLFLLSSCGGGGETKEIQIDGSSTVFPITEAIAEEYRGEAPDVRVSVGVSGTGGGFQKFLRGEIDINNASREIQPSERQLAQKNNIRYQQLSVAYDGLAVVVHPENDWVEDITVEELRQIWSPEAQGEITRWNQIREEWPDEEIHLFGPGVASGTYDYFTEVIVGESGSSRGDFTASEDDNVLVQGVATDPYALGFFGLAFYKENQDRLKLLAVDDGKGEPVKPTVETVANNTYKPLSRPLFIYVRGESAQQETVQNFVNFYLNTAPDIAGDIGYVAMPDSAYQNQKQKFSEFVESVSVTTAESEPDETQ